MQQVREWQLRQHINFSHHNHMHRSTAPRTYKEAFHEASSLDRTDRHAGDLLVFITCVLIAVAALAGLI